VIGVLIWW